MRKEVQGDSLEHDHKEFGRCLNTFILKASKSKEAGNKQNEAVPGYFSERDEIM